MCYHDPVNVIIPVAGEGTRLRPHTYAVPKSLLNVAGKPILGHILDRLKDMEISTLAIVLGDKGDAIMDFCRQYPFNFKFVLQEERLGLGHAIHLGAQGLKGPTIVLLGDTIIDVDYKQFCSSDTNILAVKEVADPRRFGVVELDGDNIVDLEEKPKQPKSNLIIVGLYNFRDIETVYDAIDFIMKKDMKVKNEFQLTDALRHLLQAGESFKTKKIEHWYDCGTADALIETNRHLLKKTQCGERDHWAECVDRRRRYGQELYCKRCDYQPWSAR
jgi:glucose-1-phosphate thymidylyltransferase